MATGTTKREPQGVGRAFNVFGMPTSINVTAQQTGGMEAAGRTAAAVP